MERCQDCLSRETPHFVHGKVTLMIIRPDKATTIIWFCFLMIFPLVKLFVWENEQVTAIWLMISALALLIVSFTSAFSVYTLDNEGITQKCVFFTRRFPWSSFKFIGVQKLTRGGGAMAGGSNYLIRCSITALPKSLTERQLEKKLYWRPSTSISIPLPDKNGDEVYREFLSYCGGERDIRE